MDLCSNQKSGKEIKIYLRFFKLATLCLDHHFADSWYSLNQLHEVVTWNAFQLINRCALLKVNLWNFFPI